MIDQSLNSKNLIDIIGKPYENLAASLGLADYTETTLERPHGKDRLKKTLENILPYYNRQSGLYPDVSSVTYQLDHNSGLVKVIKLIRELEAKYGVDGKDPLLQEMYGEFPPSILPVTEYPIQLMTTSRNIVYDGYPGLVDAHILKETIANAVEYGSKFGELGSIAINYFHGQNGLVALVDDPGIGFNLEDPTPKIKGRGNGINAITNSPKTRVNFEKLETGFRTIMFYEAMT